MQVMVDHGIVRTNELKKCIYSVIIALGHVKIFYN